MRRIACLAMLACAASACTTRPAAPPPTLAAVPAPPEAAASSPYAELTRLYQLERDGVITHEEFFRRKKELLRAAQPASAPAQ